MTAAATPVFCLSLSVILPQIKKKFQSCPHPIVSTELVPAFRKNYDISDIDSVVCIIDPVSWHCVLYYPYYSKL